MMTIKLRNIDEDMIGRYGKADRHATNCDNCGTRHISGIRYKCRDCHKFDLCSECITKNGTHDDSHKFVALRKPVCSACARRQAVIPEGMTITTLIQNQSTATIFGVHCDCCDTYVTGVLYKCFSCPDVNLCGICASIPVMHDRSHVLIKMRRVTNWLPSARKLGNAEQQDGLSHDAGPSTLPSLLVVSSQTYKALVCVICMENPKTIMCNPCHHVVYCLKCKDSLEGQGRVQSRICPVCRVQVDSFVRILM